MKTLEDLARETAAFVPFQKNRDVVRFLRNCIKVGKVLPNKHKEFRDTYTQAVKQIDRKWTWTTWRICAESEIENALVEKAWMFLTSKDNLLAHLTPVISTWNEFARNRGNKADRKISVDNVLKHFSFMNSTDICESCRKILCLKETSPKGFSCQPLDQIMFTCLMVNDMPNASRAQKLEVMRKNIPAELSCFDKFTMAVICKSMFILDWLWENYKNELSGLCEDMILYIIPRSGSENMELMQWLCDRVVDVMRRNNKHDALIHVVAKVGNKQLVEQLLCKGAEVNAINVDGKTPLQKAAEVGNVDVVQLLLDKGADLDYKNKSGCTALHKAAQEDQAEVIELLLERGANIENVNRKGDTPLLGMLAASKVTKMRAVEVLLERGANIDAVNAKGSSLKDITLKKGETFLHVAAMKGNDRVIQRLIAIDEGSLVNKTTSTGETALHFACRNGHFQAANLLLSAGANASIKNSKGRTALHEAVWNSHYEIVEILLPELTVECINGQDHNGKTALHLAAEFNTDKRIVCELLKKGSDVAVKSKEGKTALNLAVDNKHIEICNELLNLI